MKAHITLLSFLLFWYSAQGQFVESFGDGNFDQNPVWTGMSTDFWVDSQVLKLNAPAISGISYLSTNSTAINNGSWAFDVTMEFNPSSSNYLKVYLVADVANLTDPLDGYYILIGGTPDEVSLYHQSGNTTTKIIDGLDGRLSLSTVQLSVLVTRDELGNWTLQSKLASESNWYTEGAIHDDTVIKSDFFGLVCTYTSTRSTKFALDNLAVTGNPYVDNVPPVITVATIPDSQTISLIFNESIDSLSASVTDHYLLNNTFKPSSIQWQDTTIELQFNNSFELTNTLQVTNINDLSGNQLDTTLQMVYVDQSPPLLRDIVINEIMPDPSPREDLPDAEYIELLNLSDKVINLQGWLINDLVSSTTLTEYLLFPDSVVIICATNDQTLFNSYGPTVGASPWPSLNNTGDHISLEDPAGTIIDQIEYTPDWYDDDTKNEGGWSLEMIYPYHQCSSEDNWVVSINSSGGTPGRQNSVHSAADIAPPLLLSYSIQSDSIKLEFNETVRISTATVTLSPNPVDIEMVASGKMVVALPKNGMQKSVPYLLHIEGIADCNANIAEPVEFEFVLPDLPQYFDVVINEILFNPKTTGVDFIEIYNNTTKYYNLAGWAITNGSQTKIIEDNMQVMAPHSFFVLTPNSNILEQEYPKGMSENYFQTALPAMNNDKGAVVIVSAENVQLDSVFYSEAQHFELINDVEGVSLERVSNTEASSLAGNWQSAASVEDYATPGYQNSQAFPLDKQRTNFSVSPQVIVPDNNGTDDFTTLYYELNNTGFVANIDVYNLNGHLVRTLANNESLGYTGFFTWDGTDEQGVVVPMGHYIIVTALFNPDGAQKFLKNKVVVSQTF